MHLYLQVFQRRMDGSIDFYRNWQNYKLGFGEVNSEHWLGNDKLHELTSIHSNNELRFDLEAVNNQKAYAKYSTFRIGDESAKYQLTATGYSGTAGKLSSAAADMILRATLSLFACCLLSLLCRGYPYSVPCTQLFSLSIFIPATV